MDTAATLRHPKPTVRSNSIGEFFPRIPSPKPFSFLPLPLHLPILHHITAKSSFNNSQVSHILSSKFIACLYTHLNLRVRILLSRREIRELDIQDQSQKKNSVAYWVSDNDDFVRSLPIYVGGISLLAVLFNRSVSGIAPVADADRFWESLSTATCCKSLVLVYDGDCILQIGSAAESPKGGGEAVDVDSGKLMIQGTLYQGIMKSGSQSYFANLSLFPARSELPFLPPNTQAVISQPLGNRRIAIVDGNTIWGFNSADQAWISLIGDKLEATLSKCTTRDSVLANADG